MLKRSRRYVADIGDIGQIVKTKCKNGQSVVHDQKRDNLNIPNPERLIFKQLKVKLWYARIRIVRECVRKFLSDILLVMSTCKNLHGLTHQVVERAHIIEARNMILVRMRNQDSIEPSQPGPKHLLAEVGACIHNNGCFAMLNQNARSEPLVSWIVRSANRTLTTNYRNALRCSAAENGYLQTPTISDKSKTSLS